MEFRRKISDRILLALCVGVGAAILGLVALALLV